MQMEGGLLVRGPPCII